MQHRALIASLVMASLSIVLPASAETPAPLDPAAEDAFLKILPEVDIPEDVQPIPGAVNVEFKQCDAFWPPEYAGKAQSGPEARAYRDIYGLVRALNVIETRDCGCTGKAAPWDKVEVVAAVLRDQHHATELQFRHTAEISDEADRLVAIAEAMCGGKF